MLVKVGNTARWPIGLTYFAICVSHVSGVFNFILLPAMEASKCPGSPENTKADSSTGYLKSGEIKESIERPASSEFRECARAYKEVLVRNSNVCLRKGLEELRVPRGVWSEAGTSNPSKPFQQKIQSQCLHKPFTLSYLKIFCLHIFGLNH